MQQRLHLPFGNSQMAHRVRDHDWASTPLGPRPSWPDELNFAVALALDNRFPTALVWGPSLVTIHNDAFRPLLGRKPDALGRPFSEVWAEVWSDIGPITRRAMAGESTFVENLPLLIDRTGRPEKAFFTFSYSPVRGADGTVLGMIDTVVETTRSVLDHEELKEKKRFLRESELRSRTLVEDIAQATWETDPGGLVHVDSPSWRAYTGQTAPEWLGTGWLDAIHPEDRPMAQRQWREAVAAGRNVDAEFRLRRHDGGWRWTNVRAAPLRCDDGTIQKWVGMNIDIDARRAAESALKDSEARYRAFVTTSSDVVYRMGPD